jgi:hypothetical protein
VIGLVNSVLAAFACDMLGEADWAAVAATAGLRSARIEPMLAYDDAITARLLDALTARTGQGQAALLEDLGTYLVCHPATAAVRRLLRFGGTDFCDFVHSLTDLPDRVRLALPDLVLPPIAVTEAATGRFAVVAGAGLPGLDHVLTGLLRAMADDYGTLALVEHDGRAIRVSVAAADFSQGREFRLTQGAAG